MRKDKLKRLSTLLPLVISMTGGLVAPASALELSASILASQIAEALEERHLPIAQVAINQLMACNVRALRVDGVEYSMSELTTLVSRLASGEDAPLLPRPRSAAVFLIEPGDRTVEGAVCLPGEITPIVPITFPIGSQGA